LFRARPCLRCRTTGSTTGSATGSTTGSRSVGDRAVRGSSSAGLSGERVDGFAGQPVDLAERRAAADLAAAATDALGGVDILINNAGVSLLDAQAVRGDSAAARASFETNFWSPLALTTALLPAMRRAGRGTIVNVTSTIQAVPLPRSAVSVDPGTTVEHVGRLGWVSAIP
jgi:NAD(P)-dependent dehydrogenase (short-subunit alcohol dehydrogenase family)